LGSLPRSLHPRRHFWVAAASPQQQHDILLPAACTLPYIWPPPLAPL